MTEPAFEDAATTRLPSLTGARFVAAMLVVLHHTPESAMVSVPGLVHVARAGYVGVGFFFVLSGFVLTWGALPGTTTATFYLRRLSRIWPLYLITLALAIPLTVVDFPQYHSWPKVAADALLLQAWIPDQGWYFSENGVAWSLSAEFFFYALTPWLLRTRVRRPVRVLMVILAIAVVSQLLVLTLSTEPQQHWSGYIFPLAGLPAFLAGHVLALLVRQGTVRRIPLSLALVGLASCGVLAIGVDGNQSWAVGGLTDSGPGLAALVMLPGWLIIIMAMAQWDLAGHPSIGGRILERLGVWSFALYLTHSLLFRLLAELDLVVDTLPKALASFVAAVAVAAAGHYLIELPVDTRLRRRFGPHDLDPPAALSAVSTGAESQQPGTTHSPVRR